MELVYIKNYFNLAKVFVLRLFKMAANHCCRLEQRSVIKFLVTEKCKQCEIYKRMCDVYGKACFSLKMFTNGLNIGLLLRAWMGEKILGAVLIKEGYVDSLLEYEKTHHYWFPCKMCK